MLHRAIRQFKLPKELASPLSNIPYFPLESKKTPSIPIPPMPNTVKSTDIIPPARLVQLGREQGAGGMKEGRALDDA